MANQVCMCGDGAMVEEKKPETQHPETEAQRETGCVDTNVMREN